MTCARCGAVMNSGESFCGKCGTALDLPAMADDRSDRSDSPVPAAQAPARRRRWVFIAAALLVLAVLVAVGFWVLAPTEGGIDLIAVSPDGRLIADASHHGDDRLLRLRDVQSESVKLTLNMPSFIESIAFLPDSRTIAVGTSGEVSLRDTQSGAERRRIKVDESVDAIAFRPDGRMLAVGQVIAGSQGFAPVLYDLEAGQSKKLDGHNKELAKFVFSPNGSWLASVGTDDATGKAALRIWDAQSGELKQTLAGPPAHSLGYHSAFSPDSRTVAALAVDDGDAAVKQVSAILWDVQTGAQKQTIRLAPTKVYGLCPLAFSPDGKRLAVAADSEIGLWDIATGTLVQRLTGGEDLARHLAFSPDGRRLVSAGIKSRMLGGYREMLKVWEIGPGR